LLELADRHPIFEVLEQRGDRHTRAAKNPSAADAFGVAFNGITGGPIDHDSNASTALQPTMRILSRLRLKHPSYCIPCALTQLGKLL
jgi:hypothetical protein